MHKHPIMTVGLNGSPVKFSAIAAPRAAATIGVNLDGVSGTVTVVVPGIVNE